MKKISVVLEKESLKQELPFKTFLFDFWYLAPELLELVAKHNKKWISIRKINRDISTNNLRILDTEGNLVQFNEPKIKRENLIPLFPASASNPDKIDTSYYYISRRIHGPCA